MNEYEAMQVRKIFEWYINGASPMKIAERLRSEGCTNKYKSWETDSRTTVLNILENDVYLGVSKFGNVSAENAHESIVTKEQFEKAREIRKKRQEIYGDNAFTSKHLLTGMTFCGKCGARYFVKSGYGSYSYYSCYSRVKSHKSMMKADNCDNKHWRIDDLETAVEAQVKRVLFQKGYCEKLIKAHSKETKPKNNEADIIRRKISECDKQIGKLMDLFQSDGIPADVLSARIDQVYREKLQYEEQLGKTEPPKPKKDFNAENTAEMLTDLAAVWKNGDQWV